MTSPLSLPLFLKKMYLFLAVLGLVAVRAFSLAAVSGGCSLAVGRGLLTAGASPGVEHRLWVHGLP